MQTGVECQDPAPPPPDPPPSNAAGWVLGLVTVVVLVFEFWAYRKKKQTISQWVKRMVGQRKWWRLVGGLLLGSLLWHLLFGGPL